jgi:GntR family transcriptional regulator/MocR family aminotransferase
VAALRTALRDAPDDCLGYGDPRGLLRLRQELAASLGRTRGVRTTPGELLVCSGFVQALDLLGRVLRARGATAIAMETPALVHHRATVAAHGLAIVDVPTDDRGAAVERLAAAPPVAAVVLSPAHQHPLGSVLSAERRSWVLRWAVRTGAVVVEDDYDGELRYDRAPVGALQGRDPAHVVYAGTASKTLAPGLRLGWLAAPPALVRELAAAKAAADAQAATMDQLALAELLRTGAHDRHVRRMRLRYRARRDRLVVALAEHRPEVRVSGTAAGLHLVVELPPGGPSAGDVVAEAARRSLALMALGRYWHGDSPVPEALVVGYGTPPEHGYPAALDALVDTLAAVLGPAPRRGRHDRRDRAAGRAPGRVPDRVPGRR